MVIQLKIFTRNTVYTLNVSGVVTVIVYVKEVISTRGLICNSPLFMLSYSNSGIMLISRCYDDRHSLPHSAHVG